MHRIAEACAVHEHVVLREERIRGLQDFEPQIAHQLQLPNLFFERDQCENIGGIRSDTSRLIRVGHDEPEAQRQSGSLAGRLEKSNLGGEREIAGVVRAVHARQLQVRNERHALRFNVQKILNRAFHFYFSNFADAHPQVQHADGGFVAAQAGDRKTNVLKKVESDFRANVAGGHRLHIGCFERAILRRRTSGGEEQEGEDE